MNLFVYTLNILIICCYLLSGIFILLLRGARPPVLYMLLNRFLGALFGLGILLQVSQTPIYGRVLWNPSHVLMSLTLYPLLFTYVFSLLRPDSVKGCFLLLTFLPATALTALYFVFEAHYGRLPLFEVYDDLRNHLDMPQLWVKFAATGLSGAMMVFFTVRAIGMLRRHKHYLESDFSYTEGSTLEWMWGAIGITFFQWSVVLACITVEGGIAQMIALFLFIAEPVFVTALILRQKDLQSKSDTDVELGVDATGLSSEKRKKLQSDLLVLLEKEEIFKDAELNTDKICKMLNTNRTYLWQVINQDMKITFYELINNRRLEKSTKIMSNPQYRDLPLYNVSEICGFKTVNAFSTLFKRKYGKTPSEWRKDYF